ncbi:hypothetical protein ACLOJK_036999 [Asimina triloba]
MEKERRSAWAARAVAVAVAVAGGSMRRWATLAVLAAVAGRGAVDSDDWHRRWQLATSGSTAAGTYDGRPGSDDRTSQASSWLGGGKQRLTTAL